MMLLCGRVKAQTHTRDLLKVFYHMFPQNIGRASEEVKSHCEASEKKMLCNVGPKSVHLNAALMDI